MDRPVYLDHHSTTPLEPRVLDAMMPYLQDNFGNASSLDHKFGYDASIAVEKARESIAKLIHARHDEIIFTSGATEADNLALVGTMKEYGKQKKHMITCQTEHKAVLDTAKYLESEGYSVTYLPVSSSGAISTSSLEDVITDDTVLVSIMAANNEIGTITDIAEIGRIAHSKGALFHTDAAQAVGHIPINVDKMNVDLMSMSAHKMYGPKGVGALYVRSSNPRVKPAALLHGGGQERNIRSGTLNTSGIVGFGKAAEIAINEMNDIRSKFQKWSAYMLGEFEKVGGILNGSKENRLAHNLNVRFPGIESKAIINFVSDQVAISAGSACTTQSVEASYVLIALGLNEDEAHSSIRVGFGRFNTDDEIEKATKSIIDSIDTIRAAKI